jgi:hypothetical protein
MKKIVLCLIVLSAFALKGQSQNEPNVVDPQSGSKKACFKLASLSISSDVNDFPTMNHLDKGFGMGQPSKGMNNMFPGNTDFMKGNHAGDMNSRKQLNLEMGFNPYSKKLGGYNKQREFDIGLTYSGSNLKDKNSNKFTSTPGDTFSHNSAIYQTDTIKRTHQVYRQEASVLGISAQYLYKTNPDKRVSLFTGYGLNIGYALTSRIYKKYSTDSVLVVSPYNVLASANDFSNGEQIGSEVQKTSGNAQPTFLTSVFIPVGINFRLSKTKEIWNQMNLFAKANVGLEAETAVSRRTHLLPYVGCSLGFAFNLK